MKVWIRPHNLIKVTHSWTWGSCVLASKNGCLTLTSQPHQFLVRHQDRRFCSNKKTNAEDSLINASYKTASNIRNSLEQRIIKSFYRFENWLLRDVHIESPEVFMEFDELLDAQGYHVEHHNVTTQDGYILKLHRVSKKSPKKPDTSGFTVKPVALLVHGFQCSSIHWFLNDRDRTLPHMLLEKGYDCWFANLRGGPHSKKHREILDTSGKFWDFSFHEMGIYDIPATIDHILLRTGNDSLHYIGHSMGCTVAFTGMAERPEYCKKIKTLIALGPAVYGTNVKNKPIRWAIAPVACFLGRYQWFRQQQLFQMELATIAKLFSPPVTCATRFGGFLVLKYGHIFGGIGSDQMKATQLAQLSRHWPQSTSAKALYHGMQCLIYKKFQQYDYGRKENLARYGRPHPKPYDLSRVSCPVATFFAMNDELCTSADVLKLSENLPNTIGNFGVGLRSFAHGDFLFGKDAHQLVYNTVIELLRKTEKQNKNTGSRRFSARY